MNKCPKNEEFIVKAENDGARTCLILFPDDRKTGSRHLTVNEGNSRPSWNSMVHYPNWQRETAQTRLSFGSNPK